MVNGEWLMVNG